MTEEAGANSESEGFEQKAYTKADVQEALSAIARRVVESHSAYMHSMLLLNHLLRLPNATELFDDDLKTQARDLWLKVKSSGLQLNDPPLLFGFGAPADGGTEPKALTGQKPDMNGGDRGSKKKAGSLN